MTVDMPHLRPEARELAALPAAERLAHPRSDRWIGYGRARLALGELDRLFRQEPGRVRP